ncbi:hypothetical protein KA005_64250 [bacterium]|nr:hypothetical protein [bacterium]
MDLASHLQSSAPGVGYAVESGEAIAKDNNYQLIDFLSFLRASRFSKHNNSLDPDG